MHKFRKILDGILLTAASILIIFLVIGALWQVFTRFVLNDPSIVTQEVLRFSLIWVAMLGASYAFGTNEHISLTFLRDKFKGTAYKWLRAFIDLTVVVFSLFVLVIGGSIIVNSTMSETSPILQVPMGWVYIILPVSGVIIIIYQVMNAVQWMQSDVKGSEQS